jgi:hypothetical protein
MLETPTIRTKSQAKRYALVHMSRLVPAGSTLGACLAALADVAWRWRDCLDDPEVADAVTRALVHNRVIPCAHAREIELHDGARVCTGCSRVTPGVAS